MTNIMQSAAAVSLIQKHANNGNSSAPVEPAGMTSFRKSSSTIPRRYRNGRGGRNKDMTFREAEQKMLASPFGEGRYASRVAGAGYDSDAKAGRCREPRCMQPRLHGSSRCGRHTIDNS